MNTEKIELYCQNLSSDEALMLINYLYKIDNWYKAAEPLNDNSGVVVETKVDMILRHSIGYNIIYANVKLEYKVEGAIAIPDYLGLKFSLDFRYDKESTDYLSLFSDKRESDYVDLEEWEEFKKEFVSALEHHIEVLKFNKISRLNPDDVDNVSGSDKVKLNEVEDTKSEETPKEDNDDV